jgi:ribosomal-protein-alanine N-acetyltransferase
LGGINFVAHVDARCIETERLFLRLPRMEDTEALFSIYSEALTMRYISTGRRTYEQVWQQTADLIRCWERQPWGTWAVTWKENEALIGTAGFVHEEEIGYIYDRAYWGRGIATEALQACLRYGFEHLKLEVIGAGALKENAASLRVIEKAGLHPVPKAFYDIHGGAYFEIERATYQPSEAIFRLHLVEEV